VRRADSGFQLVEMLVAVAVAAVVIGIAVPPLLSAAAGLEVRLAAGEVESALRLARAYAVAHAVHVGVKFRTASDGTVTWALYRDGDGDGVRTDDIETGVDPLTAPCRRLAHFGRRVRFGFPPGPPPRDPGDPRRRLDRLDDPIRFNRSDIASFGPLSGSTPGSIFLTDGIDHLAVVRVASVTARARILRYDARQERWR
jgi:prepilin-type N-terminal cleavage/methylation domain-containing protein